MCSSYGEKRHFLPAFPRSVDVGPVIGRPSALRKSFPPTVRRPRVRFFFFFVESSRGLPRPVLTSYHYFAIRLLLSRVLFPSSGTGTFFSGRAIVFNPMAFTRLVFYDYYTYGHNPSPSSEIRRCVAHVCKHDRGRRRFSHQSDYIIYTACTARTTTRTHNKRNAQYNNTNNII